MRTGRSSICPPVSTGQMLALSLSTKPLPFPVAKSLCLWSSYRCGLFCFLVIQMEISDANKVGISLNICLGNQNLELGCDRWLSWLCSKCQWTGLPLNRTPTWERFSSLGCRSGGLCRDRCFFGCEEWGRDPRGWCLHHNFTARKMAQRLPHFFILKMKSLRQESLRACFLFLSRLILERK